MRLATHQNVLVGATEANESRKFREISFTVGTHYPMCKERSPFVFVRVADCSLYPAAVVYHVDDQK